MRKKRAIRKTAKAYKIAKRRALAKLKVARSIRKNKIADLEFIANNLKEQNNILIDQLRPYTNPTWTTGDGVKLPMAKMEDRHLQNAISFCSRRLVHTIGTTVWMSKTKHYAHSLSLMLQEAERRGLRV